MDTTKMGISDQFLKQAMTEIEDALKDKRRTKLERTLLSTHRDVLLFLCDERKNRKQIQEEIQVLRHHSVLLIIKENKAWATVVFTALLIISNYWSTGWILSLLRIFGFPVLPP